MESNQGHPFRFRTYAWKQFKKNKPAYVSLYILALLSIIALLAPLLANERPWYMKYHDQIFFPAFSLQKNYAIKNKDGTVERIQLDITDWKHFPAEQVIWAPIPYSPGKSDYDNPDFTGPGRLQKFRESNGQLNSMPPRFRHWLGTGLRGDDLLSGLIHGMRISLTIGFISMGIASLIGIFFGACAGFFGDDQLVITRGRFWTTTLGLFFAWFYGFQVRSDVLSESLKKSGGSFMLQVIIGILIFLVVVSVFSMIGKMIGRIPVLKRQMHIPVDSMVSRLIEVLVSLPVFMLIIAVAAISKPSIVNVMVIIGLTNWTGIARLTRAEMLRIRNQEYIQSARALGFSKRRILLRHALPNAIAPALISISFGIANAILIESSLSFIGIGVPPGITSWGSLLYEGRGNFDAWWMVLFPGLCIFITITTYNLIGEGLRDALDPRLKR